MNWKQIQKKYPEAHAKMNKWLGQTEVMDRLIPHKNNAERWLYDFFDKHKIYGQAGKNLFNWGYKISENLSGFAVSLHKKADLKSRKSAEKDLFTKCFEILEGRLK